MEQTYVIENATILTMNENRDLLKDASIVIHGDRIQELGDANTIHEKYPEAAFIDGYGKVVMPGLVNSHTHISMSYQKGITLAVPEGLYRVMWPVEKALTDQDIYQGALIGGAEALLNGCTTVVDHYFSMEQIARATVELGLRGFLGHTIMSRLGPFTGEGELKEGIDFARRWKDKNPLVVPMLAPHASDTVKKEWLLELRQEADEQKVGIHMHLAQSNREYAYIKEQYGMGCVEYLSDIGFLRPDVLAAHCIFIEDQELEVLVASGAHPLYCPMGHSLGGNPMRAWELLEMGSGVLLATDCVTKNNVMDLLGELRIAGAAQKQMVGDGTAMPSMKILEMVTIDAAEAIGMKGQLGRLVPGYFADVIMVNMHGLHAMPNYSVIDNIIYTCTGRDVEMVMVNGRIVVANGKLQTADVETLIEMADVSGRALIQRAVENDEELTWLWER